MYIWFKSFGPQHPFLIKIAQEIGVKNNNNNNINNDNNNNNNNKNKRRSLNFS